MAKHDEAFKRHYYCVPVEPEKKPNCIGCTWLGSKEWEPFGRPWAFELLPYCENYKKRLRYLTDRETGEARVEPFRMCDFIKRSDG